MFKKLVNFFIIVSLLGLFLTSFAMSSCGVNGMHINPSLSSTCEFMNGDTMMAMDHISGMAMVFLAVFVKIIIIIVVFFYRFRLQVYQRVQDKGSTNHDQQQGINSYYYLMKPFDRLLFYLTKIYRKHFFFVFV